MDFSNAKDEATLYTLRFDSDTESFIRVIKKKIGIFDDYTGVFNCQVNNKIDSYRTEIVHINDEIGEITYIILGHSHNDDDDIFSMMQSTFISYCQRQIKAYQNKINYISNLS